MKTNPLPGGTSINYEGTTESYSDLVSQSSREGRQRSSKLEILSLSTAASTLGNGIIGIVEQATGVKSQDMNLGLSLHSEIESYRLISRLRPDSDSSDSDKLCIL